MSNNVGHVAVVGAGIVGTAIAFELQRRGTNVVLIDKDAPGKGASYGNMASIAVTEFLPASRPSIWAQMPKWLLDPEGPVRIRPSYLPRLMPWFLRFLAASRPSKLRELEAAGAALCHRVHEDFDDLLKHTGLAHMLSAEGCLSLYADEAEFRADREHIEVLERFGRRRSPRRSCFPTIVPSRTLTSSCSNSVSSSCPSAGGLSRARSLTSTRVTASRPFA
jgi:D-amino-acid dehydrogenase